MSKYNNVNPGQYKAAGRERPNKVADVRQKQTHAELVKNLKKKDDRKHKRNG